MKKRTSAEFETIKSISKVIKKKFHPKKIILFGSYAYGESNKASDIDLFIIMNTRTLVKKQSALIRRELTSSLPIDIIVRIPQQVKERIKMGDFFIQEILEKGIIL